MTIDSTHAGVSRHAPSVGALLALLVALAVGSTAASVHAQQRGPIHGIRLEAHIDLAWHSAFGVGMRVEIPIVPDGFIDGVRDELALSAGAEVFLLTFSDTCRDLGGGVVDCGGSGTGFGLWPLVAAQWNFYFAGKWSAFPELGIAFILFDDNYAWRHGGRSRDFYARPFFGLGFRYHFSDRNALLVRVNWPAGLQVGITF